jgi:hypothetical protein
VMFSFAGNEISCAIVPVMVLLTDMDRNVQTKEELAVQINNSFSF